LGMDPSSTEKNKQPIRGMENESSEEISQPQSVEDRIHVRAPRRRTMEYNARPAVVEGTFRHRTSRTLAMKCLRPQTRSNMHQFMIGVEDLVNETAMLASLDHPNIIKLHGRAKGCDTNSFRLSDGYFILLDRLLGTLEDSIVEWKRAPSVTEKSTSTSPWTSQIQTVCSIADAMSYLHSKNIVFRDLKPANVGFNSTGVLKLFDFGFAKKVVDPPNKSSPSSNDGKLSHLLYERCGTVRYMAPEVGLELGHSLPADVYSFGILLWEICSLKKPYDNTKSTIDFDKTVFRKGARPKLSKEWSTNLKDIMANCWLPSANERPTMIDVKSKIYAHAREVADSGSNSNRNRRVDET
jgi:serine/threonine protein kinase